MPKGSTAASTGFEPETSRLGASGLNHWSTYKLPFDDDDDDNDDDDNDDDDDDVDVDNDDDDWYEFKYRLKFWYDRKVGVLNPNWYIEKEKMKSS